MNAVAGIAWEGFRFGYSYSFNMSDIGRDGGVYELSVSWQGGDGSNCFGCPLHKIIFSYFIFFFIFFSKPLNFSLLYFIEICKS